MALTRVQKIQIEAVKTPEGYFAKEYDNYVLITDGVSGIYISPEKLIINSSKLKQMEGPVESLDPERILTDTFRIERTKKAMLLDSKMAVRFCGAGGGRLDG